MLFIKSKLKKILSFFGLKILTNFKLVLAIQRNVFNKNYKKHVLLSYITEPFFFRNNLSHTNLLECYTAAEIFDEFGFCVDVVDYNSNTKINYSKYDIIYGMGVVLERSFYFNKKKIKRIFYATDCNPIFSNIETLLRVRDFYDSHGVLLLESSRFIEQSCYLQTFLSDKVIILGNDFALKTYQNYDKNRLERFSSLPAFFYDIKDVDINTKNFLEAKKHFLWFGSLGAIHKGLDILIDIFSKHQEIYLHICGLSKNENGFLNCYKEIFLQSKNIINHGFVNMRSEKFKDLMNGCAFVVLPSVSEGGAPAILNVVANGGLIPIITESADLDVKDFGIIIKKSSIESTETIINNVLQFDENKLLNMAKTAQKEVRQNYTFDKYRENLKKLIKYIQQ